MIIEQQISMQTEVTSNLTKSESFVNAIKATDQELSEILKGDIPIKLDWANRWLKGDEYAHILTRMNEYCSSFGLQKFSQKTHPECIYTSPESKFIIRFHSQFLQTG